jgi:predicted MFS family arabinose efflux permease
MKGATPKAQAGAPNGLTGAAAWWLITIKGVIGCLVMMAFYSGIVLISAIAAEFAVGPNGAAWAVTAFGLIYAGTLPLFGALSDRRGRKQVFVPGLVALAVATLLVALSPSFPALIALRAAEGVAAATYVPVVLAYLRETVPRRLAPTAIAVFSFGLLVAGVLGQVYGAAIASRLGWRWVYFLLAAAYLAAALVSSFLPGAPPPPSRRGGALIRPMIALSSRGDLRGAYAAALVVLLAFTAMYTGLQRIHGQGGVAVEVDILTLRLIDMPGMLTCLLAGVLAERFWPGRVAVAGLFVAALGLAVEGTARGSGVLILGSLIFVAGISLAFPSLLELIARTAGEARGVALALAGFALFSGASLGPVLASALIGRGFGELCLVLGVVLVAGAAGLMLGSPRTAERKR